MSDHDRCGCEESAALRRELESGTVAVYRARCLDAERARDELAREVERLTQERDDMHALSIHSCSASCQRPTCVIRRERDEARAQLAALRKAASAYITLDPSATAWERAERFDAALADTAAAAEAHDRRVRAEALRWEADRWSDQDDDVPRRLRARADEIEGGGR